MHSLYHVRPRVSSVRVLRHWVVTGRHAVLRHALAGGERLRHHHRYKAAMTAKEYLCRQPIAIATKGVEGGKGWRERD